MRLKIVTMILKQCTVGNTAADDCTDCDGDIRCTLEGYADSDDDELSDGGLN